MASASSTAAGPEPRFSLGYRGWMLGLLVAIYACGFIDRIIVATIGQAIKVDLKLSDFEFGLLGGMAFALFYALFGIPVARLAERSSRVTIISVCVALWSVMTALCGTAHGYVQLLIYRMGVGVGEGGCTPAAHSLLSDYYPPQKRGAALAVYSLGVPLGSMLGAVAGGWVAQHFNWRIAFFVVGLPGLVLALLARLTVREPPRGLSEPVPVANADKTPSLGATLKCLLASPALRQIAIGCMLTNLAANGVNQFAPSYLVRSFGLGLAVVGLLYGLVVGGSGTIGMLAGGFGADLGVRRDARWSAWIPAIGSILAAPCFLFAFTRPDVPTTAVLIFVGSVCYSLYFAPTFAVVHNLVEPRMRATAAAVMLLLMNVLGQGLGPTAIGWFSDHFAAAVFTGGDYALVCPSGVAPHGAPAAVAGACMMASAEGLRRAILISGVFFVWGAVHYLIAAVHIKRELGERVRT